MAHSPKAFLLTFHLLVRKSHYQHKMNFLKLEAYPLLARIRQLLPVLGQCLMYPKNKETLTRSVKQSSKS